MKVCSSCKIEKSLDCFGVRMASKDGLLSACKICIRERDRIRDKSELRILTKKLYSISEKGIEAGNRAKKKYLEKNKKKRSVHIKTGNAIRDGILIKLPCEVCGSLHVHSHHDDYDKPLEVRWLCPRHHNEWHEKNGEGLNGN